MRKYTIPVLAAAFMFMTFVMPVAAAESTAVTPDTAPPGVEDVDSKPIQDALYQIHPEDILRVDVWGEPTLQNLQLQVTPDGHINVAYIGDVKATGLTAQQLSKVIADKLIEAEILVSPKVQVTVLSVRKVEVSVLGMVYRPGLVELKDGGTVIEAIARAGSFIKDEADLGAATITRKESNKSEPLNLKAIFHDGDLSQNLVLQRGDTLYIPEDTKNKFYVMGEVIRPGQFLLKDNMTILSAISLAGGQTQRGSVKSMVLVRDGERVPVDIVKLINKGDLSQDIPIKPGDVVYIPESKKPDWGKISQILGTISSLGYIRRFGLF